MLALVTKTIERNRMLKKGDKIVVGVSGGADSVCLLDVLNKLKDKYNLKITVVHINHCIRGQEADRDEAFVKALAEKYGNEYKAFSYPVEKMAEENGTTVEEMGRNLRYYSFRKIAGEKGKIAVAHNKNDNCETMLMRFFRGTGVKGLGGISPVRGNIIRPLISVDRVFSCYPLQNTYREVALTRLNSLVLLYRKVTVGCNFLYTQIQSVAQTFQAFGYLLNLFIHILYAFFKLIAVLIQI